MILKIAVYGESDKTQWRYIDNVAEVSTFDVFLRKVEREDGQTEVLGFFSTKDGDDAWRPDMVFLPDALEKSVLGEKPASHRVSAFLMTSRERVGHLVAFREAYLMNDDGKTIERL